MRGLLTYYYIIYCIVPGFLFFKEYLSDIIVRVVILASILANQSNEPHSVIILLFIYSESELYALFIKNTSVRVCS